MGYVDYKFFQKRKKWEKKQNTALQTGKALFIFKSVKTLN